MAAELEALVGKEVVNKAGDKVSVAGLCEGDVTVIGLYCSAHWCPPCRGFTPQLAEFYTKFNAAGKGHKLEVIFLTCDQNEQQFKDYYNTMPWLAMPFDEREKIQETMTKFGIRGIPSFVLLDAKTGKVINPNARSDVTNDMDGENFPWAK